MSKCAHHPLYGRVEVLRERFGGYEVEILLNRLYDVRVWVSRRQLTFEEENPQSGSSPGGDTESQAKCSREAQQSKLSQERAAVEMLRMGLAPPTVIKELTVGRERETQQVKCWLNSQIGSAILVGPYGSGKTHFLEYLSRKVLDWGFAVARVSVEPRETPFSKPKRVYHAIAQSLTVPLPEAPGRNVGFREFVLWVKEKGGWKDHPFFSRLPQDFGDEQYWAWLEACDDRMLRPSAFAGPRFMPLYADAKAVKQYTYLLTSLSWTAVTYAHLKGLVLLIDEAENLKDSWTQPRVSYDTCRTLMAVADPVQCLASLSSLDLPESGRPGLTSLPFAYAVPSHLKLLFAWAEDPTLNERDYLFRHLFSAAPPITLSPLDTLARRTAAERVSRLYDAAYGWKAPEPTLAAILECVTTNAFDTRRQAKATVELLDHARHNGKGVLHHITDR